MEKIYYCDICDNEIFIRENGEDESSPSPSTAYKRKGVKNPRKLYCGSCASDEETGYVSDKFEQA